MPKLYVVNSDVLATVRRHLEEAIRVIDSVSPIIAELHDGVGSKLQSPMLDAVPSIVRWAAELKAEAVVAQIEQEHGISRTSRHREAVRRSREKRRE